MAYESSWAGDKVSNVSDENEDSKNESEKSKGILQLLALQNH